MPSGSVASAWASSRILEVNARKRPARHGSARASIHAPRSFMEYFCQRIRTVDPVMARLQTYSHWHAVFLERYFGRRNKEQTSKFCWTLLDKFGAAQESTRAGAESEFEVDAATSLWVSVRG
eukprot:3174539-Pyramimonas_sp.AAC.1